MKSILLNSVAIIVGLIFGSLVNMGLISLGTEWLAPPEGVDLSSMQTMAATMHLYQPKHYIFPFFAHAVGTLAGAMLAAKIAFSHKFKIAMVIGVAFLAGGITMVLSLPSPIWFNSLDLIAAYLPMAYLGYRLATKSNQANV